jgi:hypothetical protein
VGRGVPAPNASPVDLVLRRRRGLGERTVAARSRPTSPIVCQATSPRRPPRPPGWRSRRGAG